MDELTLLYLEKLETLSFLAFFVFTFLLWVFPEIKTYHPMTINVWLFFLVLFPITVVLKFLLKRKCITKT